MFKGKNNKSEDICHKKTDSTGQVVDIQRHYKREIMLLLQIMAEMILRLHYNSRQFRD